LLNRPLAVLAGAADMADEYSTWIETDEVVGALGPDTNGPESGRFWTVSR